MAKITDNFDLDAAIDHLEKAANSSEGERVRAALADHTLTIDQIRETLPDDFSVLLPLLLFDPVYNDSYESAPEEARSKLARAREIAQEHFGSFANHPAINERFDKALKELGASPEDWPDLAENRRVFIGTEPLWQEEDGKLVPTTRLAFLGAKDKATVLMVADPTDPLLLSGSLLAIANAEFKRCLAMAEKGLLKFPYEELVPRLLDGIESELKELRKAAKELGIDKPVAPGTSDQSSARSR